MLFRSLDINKLPPHIRDIAHMVNPEAIGIKKLDDHMMYAIGKHQRRDIFPHEAMHRGIEMIRRYRGWKKGDREAVGSYHRGRSEFDDEELTNRFMDVLLHGHTGHYKEGLEKPEIKRHESKAKSIFKELSEEADALRGLLQAMQITRGSGEPLRGEE